MKWNEIHLIADRRAADLIAVVLDECGGSGCVFDEDGRVSPTVGITAYFADGDVAALQQLRQRLHGIEAINPHWHRFQLTAQIVDDKDWLYRWQAYFEATQISDHFWCVPAWESVNLPAGEEAICIDPGLAFGSGLHATTALCVRFLEEVVNGGDLVFDIGTGTGILAIAAAKLGAAHVAAIDLDEQAVAQAVVNIGLNDVSPVAEASTGDLLSTIPADGMKADVIVANLVTDAVLRLLPTVGVYMKDGAYLIVSGIIDERIDEVKAAAATASLAWCRAELSDGWYAVLLRRRK
ncbi:50S ribosomal protein L11 methyltransferase [Megasphaera vaginalis (ex Srinivasan et al. 2021)]|uniref:Ribosomal protein L11 methyltransferase n=1 Tax=Megasphaera vaginalis (ex Srinivasan et al. 2021) TaxID=1111454 RepID=U7UND9_9FIRM|nr:50S ribosomal protein L11 methyltransferase [Megasphaera vaginalis (ex Srinivasan et al. 2021)]ERT60003.1 ribosomal protein L11 methyltransferase [Megasphaera vaginalis (ex Srinivasan et al. 2021)]